MPNSRLALFLASASLFYAGSPARAGITVSNYVDATAEWTNINGFGSDADAGPLYAEAFHVVPYGLVYTSAEQSGTGSLLSYAGSVGGYVGKTGPGEPDEGISSGGGATVAFTSDTPISFDINFTVGHTYDLNWFGNPDAATAAGVTLSAPGFGFAPVTSGFNHATKSSQREQVSVSGRFVGTADAGSFGLAFAGVFGHTPSNINPFTDGFGSEDTLSAGGNIHVSASGVATNSVTPVSAANGPYTGVGVASSTTVQVVGTSAPAGLRTNELSITSGGAVDVDDSSLVVDYTGTSPFSTIKSQIISGHNSGAWTGTGINSSSAAANGQFGVGYAEASTLGISTWRGEAVDSTTVIVDYCLLGDVNLSGTVDFDDLTKVSQNYNTSGKLWSDGDVTYDGNVDFDDSVKVSQNYNMSGRSGDLASQLAGLNPDFVRDFLFARSLIPEPSSLAAIGAIATVLLRRRR